MSETESQCVVEIGPGQRRTPVLHSQVSLRTFCLGLESGVWWTKLNDENMSHIPRRPTPYMQGPGPRESRGPVGVRA